MKSSSSNATSLARNNSLFMSYNENISISPSMAIISPSIALAITFFGTAEGAIEWSKNEESRITEVIVVVRPNSRFSQHSSVSKYFYFFAIDGDRSLHYFRGFWTFISHFHLSSSPACDLVVVNKLMRRSLRQCNFWQVIIFHLRQYTIVSSPGDEMPNVTTSGICILIPDNIVKMTILEGSGPSLRHAVSRLFSSLV